MERTDIQTLKLLVRSGYEIVWTGYKSENEVNIRLNNREEDKLLTLELSTLIRPDKTNVVLHLEATHKPGQFVDITWHRGGWLKAIRTASIYGVNISSPCEPGLGTIPSTYSGGCTMGYDIEVSQSLTKYGSFPPPYSAITSISIWCTCGYCRAWTTIRHSPVRDLVWCYSSKRLVRLALSDIRTHMPRWLVGYNCYQFDNCVLQYHCPNDLLHLFRTINSGTKAMSSHAFYIDILGVNNVDLYTYLDKCLRSEYTNLGLDAVAKHHYMEGKLTMPKEETEESVYDLIKYNIVDSKLTALLWHETGVCKQVIGLCVASCSPVIDCVRYITGTMASCAVSSYCISQGKMMDWSQCNLRIGYEGGTVLEPIRSLFKHVTVCDFSSMYPTLMRDIAVSPENIEVLNTCSKVHDDKLLWWGTKNGRNYTLACIKGKIVRYDSDRDCMTKSILTNLMELRSQYKKVNVPYSTALKVLANSLYGALGYANSPLHSPRCAATVTVAGRTALALAYTVFTGLGLTVVYGDTDSCFLTAGERTKTYEGGLEKHIDDALKIFHRVVKFTPFPSMRMEREDEYKSILLVDKKHYAYAKGTTIKTKGLSTTRKDRLGICRDLTDLICRKLLQSEDIEQTRHFVVHLVNSCYSVTRSGQLDAYSVSKEVRYEGVSCYVFTNSSNEDIYIPVTHADKLSQLDYDPTKIENTIERDVNRLCIPAGLGCVSNMLKDAEL